MDVGGSGRAAYNDRSFSSREDGGQLRMDPKTGWSSIDAGLDPGNGRIFAIAPHGGAGSGGAARADTDI